MIESTAAAMSYGLLVSGDKNVMVVDIGGGTTDVTIMRISNGNYVIENTGGHSNLGFIIFFYLLFFIYYFLFIIFYLLFFSLLVYLFFDLCYNNYYYDDNNNNNNNKITLVFI
jgi:hypothetical protein